MSETASQTPLDELLEEFPVTEQENSEDYVWNLRGQDPNRPVGSTDLSDLVRTTSNGDVTTWFNQANLGYGEIAPGGSQLMPQQGYHTTRPPEPVTVDVDNLPDGWDMDKWMEYYHATGNKILQGVPSPSEQEFAELKREVMEVKSLLQTLVKIRGLEL